LKEKALFIYTSKTSFIQKDIEMLSHKWDIIEYQFKNNKGILLFFQLIHQFIFICVNIRKCRYVYIAFAQYHSVLPTLLGRLFRVRTFIMVGGTDAHYFPEYYYGNFNKKPLALATCISLGLSSRIFPKHKSLIYSDYLYDSIKIKKQGYVNLCNNKNLEEKSIVIENGYDSEKWHRNCNKEKIVLTVGSNLHEHREFIRKGIDMTIELAKVYNEYQFVIIGGDKLPSEIPSNVKLIKFVKNNELIDWYSRALIYLQMSTAEGFPNALCEAMLCECVPFGSNVFGIPDIINNKQLILPIKDKDILISMFQDLIESDLTLLGKYARDFINDNYSYQRRLFKLNESISQII
jgi:hypothetical protein